MSVKTAVRRLAIVATVVLMSVTAWTNPAVAAEEDAWQMWNGRSMLCIGPQGRSSATNVPIEQAGCADSIFTLWWLFEPTDQGWYRLRNVVSRKCMNVQGGSTATGAKIIQYPCTTNALNDQFKPWPRFSRGGYDYYNLIARHSGKCLNNPGNSMSAGTDLIQYPCTATEQNDVFSWRPGTIITVPTQP
jgi:galactose oxidase